MRSWASVASGIGRAFERVAVRHLTLLRTEKLIQKLQQFLRLVVGNKYELKPGSFLFQRQSVRLQNDDVSGGMVEEGRGFSCSELVAKCYKVCGIMQETEEASSSFLPSDFSYSKQRVRLVDGVSLGQE